MLQKLLLLIALFFIFPVKVYGEDYIQISYSDANRRCAPYDYYILDKNFIDTYDSKIHNITKVTTCLENVIVDDETIKLEACYRPNYNDNSLDIYLINNSWGIYYGGNAKLLSSAGNEFGPFKPFDSYYTVPTIYPGEIKKIGSLKMKEFDIIDLINNESWSGYVVFNILIEIPECAEEIFVASVYRDNDDSYYLVGGQGGSEYYLYPDCRICAIKPIDVNYPDYQWNYFFEGSSPAFSGSWEYDIYLLPNQSCELTYYHIIQVDEDEYTSPSITKTVSVDYYPDISYVKELAFSSMYGNDSYLTSHAQEYKYDPYKTEDHLLSELK